MEVASEHLPFSQVINILSIKKMLIIIRLKKGFSGMQGMFYLKCFRFTSYGLQFIPYVLEQTL